LGWGEPAGIAPGLVRLGAAQPPRINTSTRIGIRRALAVRRSAMVQLTVGARAVRPGRPVATLGALHPTDAARRLNVTSGCEAPVGDLLGSATLSVGNLHEPRR